MRRSAVRAARLAAGTAAVVLVVGLSGCAAVDEALDGAARGLAEGIHAEQVGEGGADGTGADGRQVEHDAAGTPDEPPVVDEWLVRVRPGDCVQTLDAEAAVTTLPVVDCDRPHEAEAFARVLLPEGRFPGEEVLMPYGEKYCLTQFAEYVGVPWHQSYLDVVWYLPDAMGWQHYQDRKVLCVLVSVEGPMTGSVEGTGA